MLSQGAIYELKRAATHFKHFCRYALGVEMRPYQLEAGEAILRSVFARDGRSFVILFARQSGKDELLADLFLFLLFRLQEKNANMVCAQPTFKPQTVNAMERLLERGLFFGKELHRTAGYIIRHQTSRVVYFSTDPSAHVVGATADRLLVINEAQDVRPSIYDKRFAPMAASGNATKVFSGTSWTSNTLLERERQAALKAEQKDGMKRVFQADAEEVARNNEYYGIYVQGEIERMGRNHPLIKSQYFNELIDAETGMFHAGRTALMQGDQAAEETPTEGNIYAFLIDVAGQDETRMSLDDEDSPLANPGRDSTTLSIASIDLSTLATLRAPTFRIVKRMQWVGENHLTLFGKLKSLVEAWTPQHIVIDATGVGEGLWALLEKAFPRRVLAVKFSQHEKSEIGWRFLAVIETGRFRDCAPAENVQRQYAACRCEVIPGPAKTLRWGVPEGARDAEGEIIHDDHLMADALVAKLDTLEWYAPLKSVFIPSSIDPLKEMEGNY